MYTENELKVAKFLGINPDYILGFKKDPELKGFVTDLITLQKNSNSMDAEISRLPPPAPGGKTLEEVLREVRQEVWDSLTFGYSTPRVEYTCALRGAWSRRLRGETLRLKAAEKEGQNVHRRRT